MGSYEDNSFVPKSFIERWDGTTWSVVASPNPAASTAAVLNGVSCASATNCIAVGNYTKSSGQRPLAERWNGTTWSLVAPTNPPGAMFPDLNGVSCPSTTSCFAVGNYETGAFENTLVEQWNGTSWSIVASPNAAGAPESILSGVSCPTTADCTAVGREFNGSDLVTLAEQWNGTSWSIVASPNPTGAGQSDFSGVSCAIAASCYGVGYSSGPVDDALVEHWDGTTWSIVTNPSPTISSFLAGVTCASTASCFAVGSSLGALVERWDGVAWSIAAPPASSSQSALAAVSCPSTTSCIAVGAYADGTTEKSLVESGNGTSWSLVASPNPTGSNSTILYGVSCPGSTSCFAVGSFVNSSFVTKSLVERWNGTTWTRVANPNPTGANNVTLNAVSCTAATSCFAVGSSSDATDQRSLVERWNGTTWTLVTSPNPAGASNVTLSGVSCPTSTSCFAVGSFVNTSFVTKSLVERWNGTTWTRVTNPNPAGSSSTILNGVSCPTTTSCFAVGSSVDSSFATNSFVESWNGTTWSIGASPNPAGGTESSFNGVSCSTTTSCFAVGSYVDNASTVSLAESWNGTSWSPVAPPNPAGVNDTALKSVSCPTDTNCSAVGSYSRVVRGRFTLVERYT